jgi:hypothetical protein
MTKKRWFEHTGSGAAGQLFGRNENIAIPHARGGQWRRFTFRCVQIIIGKFDAVPPRGFLG